MQTSPFNFPYALMLPEYLDCRSFVTYFAPTTATELSVICAFGVAGIRLFLYNNVCFFKLTQGCYNHRKCHIEI